MQEMEQWITNELSRILDFEVPDDLIKYVMSIQNEADLNEYLKTLLNFDDPKHKNFIRELVNRKFSNRGNNIPKREKKKISKTTKPQQDFVSVEKPNGVEQQAQTSDIMKTKKKTKFVNLYSTEGQNAQVVMLKGRHHCDCEASKHGLINNCLNCGRIVCTQEGSGPCLFCGALVCTEKEEQEIGAKTQDGTRLAESLMNLGRPKGWEAAMALRDKLIEYDKNSEQRTRVIDDDSDYFCVNSVWLSGDERDQLLQYQQKLHEKKHASRLNKKLTFDFAGRQVIEDKPEEHNVDLDLIEQITRGAGVEHGSDNPAVGLPTDRDVAPGSNPALLQFNPAVENSQGYASALKTLGPSLGSRVQDAELQLMSDTGRCLSMHQPWASLLVEGIKMHEGRTWYTSHRGRLWIAATAKPPDQDVCRALENQYRVLYPDKNFKFPTFYPTGCLLGCVNVDDCLPQEEYQKRYPGGESDSPYVFICSNPVSLKLRFPIKGMHKIYQLEKTIHIAALKSIQTMAKLAAEEKKA